MSFPAFPAQDLAKLVLGYLMEEQLMTAYDEFLQASPYLDPFTNEYDRLCMLSLKNILAEYRAMRMLVETCKPILLRKYLLQCPSLFEMIRLLINNVDTNKLYKQEESPDKKFASKSSKTLLSRTTRIYEHHAATVPAEEVNMDVETTSPADLPGNYETKLSDDRKHRKESDVVQKAVSYEKKVVSCNSAEKEPVQSETNVQNINKGNRISLSGTFGEFASGVHGNPGTAAVVAESSTPFASIGGFPNKHLERTAGQLIDDTDTSSSNRTVQSANVNHNNGAGDTCPTPSGNPNTPKTSQKVKIISDIKVDDNILRKEFIHTQVPVGPIVTPQPLRIYINKAPGIGEGANVGFTKDEIMAMPTLILMTTSAPPMVANTIKTVHTTTEPTTTSTLTQPLSINVHTSALSSKTDCEVIDLTAGSARKKTDDKEQLLRVAMGKMPSLPKEFTEPDKACTPHGTKPVKKSSSTPRRSSHIRVLDFNTPRRILQETISENGTKQSETENLPKFDITNTAPQSEKQGTAVQNPVNKTKENKKTPTVKNKFWDSDLRSLVDPTDVKFMPKPRPKPKAKLDQLKKVKKKMTKSNNDTKSKKSSEENNKKSCKSAKSPEKVSVKLTNNDVKDTKANISDEKVTPDLERDPLHNAIGSKLNISDLFETPFKQAIYDIQMDTPRFMDTAFSDEPISAIKILNMPTPKFLNTSEAPQTPASYCSRPTDYSSGGSYYKPDEQDYIPLPEILRGSIATSSPLKTKTEDNTKGEKSSSKRTSRPVRQCTKNVSYFNNAVVKANNGEDNVKQPSVSGDNKNVTDKVLCSNEGKSKLENKKKVSKSKSPRKGTPKIHAKIKVNNLSSKGSQRSKRSKDTTETNKDSKKSKARKTSEKKRDSVSSVTDSSEHEEPNAVPISIQNGSSVRDFHEELIKRGFDLETAQIIERDFLDEGQSHAEQIEAITEMYKSKNVNAVTSNADADKDVFDDELEFSVSNFDSQSKNYYVMEHTEGVATKSAHVSFKNTFCMEVCIEDVEIRLTATEFETLYNETPEENVETNKCIDPIEETLCAIHSISNIDRLYTPRKELTRVQATCLDIFDSTLASLDTPIKCDTPTQKDVKQVLESEHIDKDEEQEKQTAATNRKRPRNGSDSDECESKKSKSLIANIQKFDIESVLSKLHGL